MLPPRRLAQRVGLGKENGNGLLAIHIGAQLDHHRIELGRIAPTHRFPRALQRPRCPVGGQQTLPPRTARGIEHRHRALSISWRRLATRQRDVPALATRHRETVARLHRRGAEPHRLQLAGALEESRRHPVAPRRDAAGEGVRAVAHGHDRYTIDRDDTTAEEIGNPFVIG